jgi:hypothetical protein
MTVNCFSLIIFLKNIFTSYITKNSIGSTKVGFNGIKILLNSIYLEFSGQPIEPIKCNN